MKDVQKEQDRVELLDDLGFRPVEIAKMLNKSPENVGAVLSNIRKKKAPKTGGISSPVSSPPEGSE